jgi:hypothetical protein
MEDSRQSPSDFAESKHKPPIRVAVPLLCATCVSIAGLAAIVLLVWHANDVRNAHDTLDDVAIEFKQLQTVPWKLITPGGGSRVAVRTELSAVEAEVTRELASLRQSDPTPALEAARAPLAANIGIQEQLFTMLADGKVHATGPQASLAYQTSATVERQFDRAGATYLQNAHQALIDATIGAAAVILGLLVGFGAFFWRSFRARASAEALADARSRSEAHLTQAQQVAGIGSWAWDRKRRQFTWSAENMRLHRWERAEPPNGFRDLFDVIDPSITKACDRQCSPPPGAVSRSTSSIT